MTDARPWIHLLALALLTVALLVLVPDSAGAADAVAALERARLAYAEAGPFHETLELELVLPDGATSSRRQDYGVGKSGGAFFRLAADGRDGLRIVAGDGRAVAVWAHVAGRYAETGYEGGFRSALDALQASQVQLAAPPAVVAAQGGDAAAFLDALRFGILQPLEPVAAREARTQDGGSVVEVELATTNGAAVIGLHAATGRLATLRVTLGEGDSAVRASGAFTFSAAEPAGELAWPDVAGRSSVATITALEASEYPIGERLEAITVPALDGPSVSFEELHGQVVVLDFWATWCVPCWSALEHTEELTAWARGSGLAVRIFAVDSLERSESLEAQREQAVSFLASRGLELDVLVDYGDRAFAAFHNPGLPSLVIVDRDGRLAEYHSGVPDDMPERVRASVLGLLDAED